MRNLVSILIEIETIFFIFSHFFSNYLIVLIIFIIFHEQILLYLESPYLITLRSFHNFRNWEKLVLLSMLLAGISDCKSMEGSLPLTSRKLLRYLLDRTVRAIMMITREIMKRYFIACIFQFYLYHDYFLKLLFSTF